MLNEGLHNQLARVFGSVVIHNEGEPLRYIQGERSYEVIGLPRSYLHIESPCEYYAVCCPFCGDTRNRLWLNHRWNTTVGGKSVKYMVMCYNENCEEMDGFRARLEEMISPDSIETFIQAPEEVQRTISYQYPGTTIELPDLPDNHPIIAYLRDERRFNIQYLNDVWGDRWIDESGHKLIGENNKLVIPYFDPFLGEELMMGWQSRWYDTYRANATPTRKKTPKYITQGKKSRAVYNLHRVRRTGTVFICEGVFDAMRIGPEFGLCVFGKSDRKSVV